MLRKFDIDLCFWIYVQEKDNLHKTAVSWLEMFSYLNSHSNVCRSSSPSSQNSPQTFATSTPLSFSSSPTFDTYKFAPFTTFTSPLSSKFDPQDGHIINLPGYIHWCRNLGIWTNNFSAVHSARRSACGSAWRSDSVQPAWGEGTALQSLPLSGFLVRIFF